MKPSIWLSIVVPGVVAGLIHCGTDNADKPGDGNDNRADDDGDGSASSDGSTILADVTPPSTDGASGLDGDACVDVTVEAQLTPLNLIFIYDKSGSMGVGDGWDNTETRWIPVRDGLLNFFSQPGGEATFASLEFFPANGDLAAACNVAAYEVPTVPLLELSTVTPDTSPFLYAINSTTPAGGTPTLPALLGSLNYARSILEEQPDSITVVILLTDGLPAFYIEATGQSGPGCTEPLENTVPNIATIAAEGLADGIQTYVIGIADDPDGLSALNQIAQAGGTTTATIIVPGDPAATTARITDELGAIREHHLNCTVPVPEAENENGDPVDYDHVAVAVTVDGVRTGINQSDGCASGIGWQFIYGDPDHVTVPTEIELCTTTCQTVQGTAGVELNVDFPCGTIIK